MSLVGRMAHPRAGHISTVLSSPHDKSHCPLTVVQGWWPLGIDRSECLSGVQWASTIPRGHSADPCAYHYRCPWVPVGSHLPVLGETISPPPTCLSCLSTPGQWGWGPAPRSPVLTPSRILGLMSCKMRRLQLTRTDGAGGRLLAQHAPSSARRVLLQT